MTALARTDQGRKADILAAIDARPTLGDRTKAQYKREITKALAAGVNVLDAVDVADYAAELPNSSRAFLSAALKTWTKRVRMTAKANATPENMASVNATIARLDALDNAIEVGRSKGEKAHTWLTAGDVRRLMATVKGRTAERDRVVLALLVGAGLRRDESVNLRWQDIKRQGDRVVLDVSGKGGRRRVVPISSALASILDAWQRRCSADEDERVLRGHASGGQLTDSLTSAQVFNVVRKAGARIGKPGLAPHDLRRSFAQLGFDNGVPITQLSRLLGHASVETTQRYLNLDLDLDVTASDFVPL